MKIKYFPINMFWRRKTVIFKTVLTITMLWFLVAIKTWIEANLDLSLESQYAPGELGRPVTLSINLNNKLRQVIYEGWKKNGFNQYISDVISVRRKLPDRRDEWCKKSARYLENLPQTTIIICFHNEAWSTLLRTVHSVIDTSPAHLIKEIILVDDFSNMNHLMKPLDEYMSRLPKVKILRSSQRIGLVKARLLGKQNVTSPTLTYLDSHCECMEGWLEPLLDRVARYKTTVVYPVLDTINNTTLEYHYRPSTKLYVGGFWWNLRFEWHLVPDIERARHEHLSEPVWSPTMPGGVFTINKEFFETLGTYDDGFDIWGGENFELSFKIWMCGGEIELIPCSHVGHIFRDLSPYRWRRGIEVLKVLKKNLARVAEVWMDEYAKYYYNAIGHDNVNYGDISSRLALRKRLNCKSFHWYLENIYPEKLNMLSNGKMESRKLSLSTLLWQLIFNIILGLG